PASLAASFVSVFFTTENVAWSPSDWRSSPSCATVRQRYSVSTAPFELWNRAVSSATAVTFSALPTGLPSSSVPSRSGAGPALVGAGQAPGHANAPYAGVRGVDRKRVI